jgi:hypothetical protein
MNHVPIKKTKPTSRATRRKEHPLAPRQHDIFRVFIDSSGSVGCDTMPGVPEELVGDLADAVKAALMEALKDEKAQDYVLGLGHQLRFRAVSTRYARLVADAYRDHGGIRQAANDSDSQVAKRVAAWERAQGVAPRNWRAIGRNEHA